MQMNVKSLRTDSSSSRLNLLPKANRLALSVLLEMLRVLVKLALLAGVGLGFPLVREVLVVVKLTYAQAAEGSPGNQSLPVCCGDSHSLPQALDSDAES